MDVDYQEDSKADVDANFVMNKEGKLVEIQGTAEHNPFSEEQFFEMLKLARSAINQLFEKQNQALGI